MKTNLIRLVLAVMVAVFGFSLEINSAQDEAYGADIFNVPVSFGGTGGGEAKMSNVQDLYELAFYNNQLAVRDLRNGQTAWIEVKFAVADPSRPYRVSGFFPVQGRESEKLSIYHNNNLLGTSTGCGWPQVAGAREFGLECYTNSFRYWDIDPGGSSMVTIRIECTVGEGVETNNLSRHIAAIDYLSCVEIPRAGDQAVITIKQKNRRAPPFGNSSPIHGNFPGSIEMSWAITLETQLYSPLTLKPFISLNGIEGPWQAIDTDNVRISHDGLFYILHVYTGIPSWVIPDGVVMRLQQY